jgi:hypothetical protein
VAGFTAKGTAPANLPASTPKVVASITPTSSGSFAVNGMAVAEPGLNGFVACSIRSTNSSGKPNGGTSEASTDFSQFATLATNGIVHATSTEPIEELCRTGNTTHSGREGRAQLTAVRLSTAHSAGPLTPANKFSLPKLRRAKSK